MIKFTATGQGGRTLIGIGLSEGNIERLREGKPIHLNLEELNLPWKADIILMYAKTEQSLADELRGFIGPQTIVHRNENRKRQ